MENEIIDKIIAYETGELSSDEIIELYKELYISNALFGLQGSYQRTFLALCEQGIIDRELLNAERGI